MNKIKYVLIVCIGIMLAAGLYYFLKDEPAKQRIPAPTAEEKAAPVMMYAGNTIIEEKDGKRLWELGAETITVDPQSRNVQIKNLKGIFYSENGGTVEITAGEALLDAATKDIVMKRAVKATASDGAVFTAEESRWLAGEKQINAAGNVVFKKDNTMLTGDKLESDVNMNKVKVFGRAKIIKGGS